MSKDEVFTKEYNANHAMITMVEFDGRPWLQWSTILGKPELGDFPTVASLPAMAEIADLKIGVDFVKELAPRTNGVIAPCWMISRDGIAKLLLARDKDTAPIINGYIGEAFGLFQIELKINKDELSSPEGSDTSTATSDSPQVDEQKTVDDSSEEEVVDLSLKGLSDSVDKSMDALAISVSNSLQCLNRRIDQLEMVKYADQLGDVAERMSNLEEKLYEYKGELADIRLVVRSLKEATGSQIQAETINRLVEMVDNLSAK